MPTKKQREAMDLYANLLDEAKIRLELINIALSGTTGLPGQVIAEFCWLQLRLLCELIALGCLTAHGDIAGAQSKKIRTEYAADKIIDVLDRLHPTFYPEPAAQSSTSDGMTHLVPVKSGYLTKAELPKLYGKSGDWLHKGNLKKLLSPKMPIQKNFPEIVEWAQKISTLLRLHIIGLIDGKSKMIGMLRNAQDNDRVQVAFAESGPRPLLPENPPVEAR